MFELLNVAPKPNSELHTQSNVILKLKLSVRIGPERSGEEVDSTRQCPTVVWFCLMHSMGQDAMHFGYSKAVRREASYTPTKSHDTSKEQHCTNVWECGKQKILQMSSPRSERSRVLALAAEL